MGQRFVRFVRRHRAAVTAAVMVVAATAIIGTLSIMQIVDERDRARTAEERASRDRDGAEGLSRFMMTDLRKRLQPLGKLALVDSIGKKVDGYYRDLLERGGDSLEPRRRAEALELRGDVARYSGDTKGALALYREAANVGLVYPTASAGHSWLSVGEVLLEQGDIAGAEHHFAMARQMISSDATVGAKARLRLGMVAAARGDHRGALAHWSATALELEALAQQYPEQLDLLHNVAVAYGMSADLQWQMNAVEDARAGLAKSRIAIEKLLAVEPHEPRWLRAMIVVRSRVGEIEEAGGNLAAAEEAYRASLAAMERLAAQDRNNSEWQSDLAISLRNVASVTHLQGRYPEAIQLLERAAGIADGLAAKDPSNLDGRRVRSSMYAVLGRVLATAGRREDAVVRTRRAIELRRDDHAKAADHAEIAYVLANSLVDLGEQLGVQDAQASLASLGEARERLVALIKLDDSMTERRATLAQLEVAHARIAAAQPGGEATARRHAAEAIKLLERLQGQGAFGKTDQERLAEARKLAR
jgi:tetratricopeptide (TPR) repeat protein